MEIKVLGCHGGETPQHRTSSFVIDGVLGVDAGAVTSMMSLKEQKKLEAVVVSHAHLDHVRDLATLADNRCQMADRPLVVAGTPGTLRALKKHFFNNVVWPDFSEINLANGGGRTLEFVELKPEKSQRVAGYEVRSVLVTHTIESAALIIERRDCAIAYSGDTGPTERLWKVLAKVPTLRALLMEVSFPNEMQWLADESGHHTPRTLDRELNKIGTPHDPRDLPVLLYHIKPHFQRQVEREIAKIKGRQLDVMSLGDELIV
jgi:3',5'-cyclic-nucleotide phosphodiesterase